MSSSICPGSGQPSVPRLQRIPPSQPQSPPNRQRTRVLIVEPDDHRAASIQRALEQQGFEVIAVLPTLNEASNAFHQPRPDLVVIDVFGNEKDAGRAAANLVQQTWQVPVVYPAALPRHLSRNRI